MEMYPRRILIGCFSPLRHTANPHDELNSIQRRQPHAAISTGNRAPVMKETASDMV